jgi:ADP-heptose:LPS heptosyltransferase
LLQRETGNDGEPQILLLNPNASDLLPLRKWPADRYVSLARRLLDAFPEIYIGLTGAPDEAGPIEAMVHEIGSPRCFSLAGKTTLRQLLVLYTLSELLITNDSGPAHFAAMTQVHTLTLFGPETPALFGARTPRAITIWQGLACSPCVNAYNNRQSSCTNNVCMQKITVDRVFDEASKVYLARAAKHEILR